MAAVFIPSPPTTIGGELQRSLVLWASPNCEEKLKSDHPDAWMNSSKISAGWETDEENTGFVTPPDFYPN